jgi:hypothetical protein
MILMNASFIVFACALIQMVRSSFYSLIQNNISSSCNFIMSNDAVWLAATLLSFTNPTELQ